MSSEAPVVLVTGGAGFVGSHAVVELINAGYKVVIIDNFYNANIGNDSFMSKTYCLYP